MASFTPKKGSTVDTSVETHVDTSVETHVVKAESPALTAVKPTPTVKGLAALVAILASRGILKRHEVDQILG